MADIMVVGQVVGVNALAALGAAEWLVWLANGIVTGIFYAEISAWFKAAVLLMVSYHVYMKKYRKN